MILNNRNGGNYEQKNEVTIRSSAAEYLTFIAATGDDKESIEVRYEDENIWLTQKMLSTLYKVEINTINYHIKKIYSDNELSEDSTIRKFRIVQKEGNREVSRDVVHYNLQMIIALGFKVDNDRAVQFRKWVNEIVKEYTIKGFAMDDERLKNSGSILTEKYFDELLERIREIRLSERRFYQKVTDIYATSIDYDKDSKTTLEFLKLTDREILQDAGKISHKIACDKAESEFEKYRIVQDRLYISDFDKYISELEKLEEKSDESVN